MFTQLCLLFPHFWKFSINIYEPILKIMSFEIRYKLERCSLVFAFICYTFYFLPNQNKLRNFVFFDKRFDQTPMYIVQVNILIQGIWPLVCVLDKSAISVYIFYNFKLKGRWRAKIYWTSQTLLDKQKWINIYSFYNLEQMLVGKMHSFLIQSILKAEMKFLVWYQH